jgi:hypothetical protein
MTGALPSAVTEERIVPPGPETTGLPAPGLAPGSGTDLDKLAG